MLLYCKPYKQTDEQAVSLSVIWCATAIIWRHFLNKSIRQCYSVYDLWSLYEVLGQWEKTLRIYLFLSLADPLITESLHSLEIIHYTCNVYHQHLITCSVDWFESKFKSFVPRNCIPISWNKTFKFWFKFHWSITQGSQLTISMTS